MSKNKPPKNPIPSPQAPETPRSPLDDPRPLTVELVHINIPILFECSVGDGVTLDWMLSPIQVTLPSGIELGEIAEKDETALRLRRTRTGRIVICDTENMRCAITV